MSHIERVERGPRFSRVVVHNGTAYLSGLTSSDRQDDIGAQTRNLLAKADELLASIGASRSELLSSTIWLRDIDHFEGMNQIWETWIDPGNPPARATVEAKLAAPDLLIEIQFTVAVGGGTTDASTTKP